jgi:hypothetical protein
VNSFSPGWLPRRIRPRIRVPAGRRPSQVRGAAGHAARPETCGQERGRRSERRPGRRWRRARARSGPRPSAITPMIGPPTGVLPVNVTGHPRPRQADRLPGEEQEIRHCQCGEHAAIPRRTRIRRQSAGACCGLSARMRHGLRLAGTAAVSGSVKSAAATSADRPGSSSTVAPAAARAARDTR